MGDRWRRDGCDDRHERHGQSRMALVPAGKRGTGHTPQITDHRVLRRRQARTVRAPGCQAHTPTSTTLRTRIYSPAPIASPRRPRRPDRYCPHYYGTTRERTGHRGGTQRTSSGKSRTQSARTTTSGCTRPRPKPSAPMDTSSPRGVPMPDPTGSRPPPRYRAPPDLFTAWEPRRPARHAIRCICTTIHRC